MYYFRPGLNAPAQVGRWLWHSPISVELRRWRQSRIVTKRVGFTRETEFSEYAIFDAYENYLAGGSVGG